MVEGTASPVWGVVDVVVVGGWEVVRAHGGGHHNAVANGFAGIDRRPVAKFRRRGDAFPPRGGAVFVHRQHVQGPRNQRRGCRDGGNGVGVVQQGGVASAGEFAKQHAAGVGVRVRAGEFAGFPGHEVDKRKGFQCAHPIRVDLHPYGHGPRGRPNRDGYPQVHGTGRGGRCGRACGCTTPTTTATTDTPVFGGIDGTGVALGVAHGATGAGNDDEAI